MKHYPELSLYELEATSMSRLSRFNKIQFGQFFDVPEVELQKKKFGAKQVYNIDEMVITTMQTPGKIIAHRGAKQVGRVVSCQGCSSGCVCSNNVLV